MLVLYVPVGQAVQAAMEVDAVLLLYVPAGQCLQALEPEIEYVPVGQLMQVDESEAPKFAECWPAEHNVQPVAADAGA